MEKNPKYARLVPEERYHFSCESYYLSELPRPQGGASNLKQSPPPPPLAPPLRGVGSTRPSRLPRPVPVRDGEGEADGGQASRRPPVGDLTY